MKTRTTTMDEADALMDRQISAGEAWLIARQKLLEKEQEIARLRDLLGAESRALTCAGIGQVYELDRLSAGRGTLFVKQAGIRLLGFVGPLIVAVLLLLQLQHPSNSSVSYSLLSAIISLLFNFSSSALLRTS